MPRIAAALLLFVLAGWAANARALDCRALQFQDKRYTVCEADLAQDRLRLFLNDGEGNPYKGFDSLRRALDARGEQLVFAMNAGMYHPDYSPVGLYVAEGVALSALNTASGSGNFFLKPNGVFYVGAAGAGILETSRYMIMAKGADLATQSGPLLLKEGEIHPRFIASSDSLRVRNGVGIVSPLRVVFAISDAPVNFYEFALLFRDALGCRDALYFDGSISSLYSTQLDRNDNLKPLGPIIGVTRPMR